MKRQNSVYHCAVESIQRRSRAYFIGHDHDHAHLTSVLKPLEIVSPQFKAIFIISSLVSKCSALIQPCFKAMFLQFR